MGRKPGGTDEKRIPLSIVFLTIGLLILGAVAAIAILVPVAPPALPALIPRVLLPREEAAPVALPTVLAATDTEEMFDPTFFRARNLPSEARAVEAPATLYESLPNQPARIIIPALEIDAPVREVQLERVAEDGQTLFRWEVPNEFAAGWHADSAPLGKRGNTVLNGHHNIHGAIFGDLAQLDTGADIYLEDAAGTLYHYQIVDEHLFPERDEGIAVRRGNASWMERKPDERITIVTCWPRTDNTHRLVVIATPVAP
jgi:LPXTG-site transpeptidase (sortase) family protein